MTRICHSVSVRGWTNAASFAASRAHHQPLRRFHLSASSFSNGNPIPKKRRNPKETRFLLQLGLFSVTIATAGISSLVYWTSGGPKASRAARTSSSLPLAYSHFTPSTVTSVEDSGEPTKLITLKIPPSLIPRESEDGYNPMAPVYSVYVKDSDIQVERPYTPLRGISETDGEMTFWIKRYERGEVGRWMNRRKVGDVVEIRGPVRTFDWSPDDKWDEVIMISGGTGITPFYQLLHNVFSKNYKQDTPLPHFTLLHASSSPSKLPPPYIMDDLHSWSTSHPDKLTLQLFVDPKSTPESESSAITKGRINRSVLEQTQITREIVDQPSWWNWIRKPKAKENPKRVLWLVCGPEPMITDLAGSRLSRPRPEALAGGVLGQLGYKNSDIRKL